MNKLTLKEKVGQLFIYTIAPLHISTEYLLRGVITETDSSLLMEKISTLTPKQYRHFEDILDSFIAAIQEEA